MAQNSTPQIIFDLDGTIIDFSDRHYLVYSIIIRQLGGSPLSKLKYWRLKRTKTDQKKILNFSKVSIAHINSFQKLFLQLIEQPRYLKLDFIFPNAITLIKQLSLRYDLSIITLRRHGPYAMQELSSLGLTGYFHQIKIISTYTNPLEAKIQAAKTILQGETGILIGDTEVDIETGKSLNCTTVAVTSGIRNRDFLATYRPSILLTTITDLNHQMISSLIRKSSETLNSEISKKTDL